MKFEDNEAIGRHWSRQMVQTFYPYEVSFR